MKKRWIVFVVMLVLCLYGTAALAAPQILPTDVSQPSEGCTFVGLRGSYVTQIQEALDRMNEIRKEACKEGVRNPDTGEALTMADYVPIRWSSDLEYIARIRAAEASITMDHVRTNGESSFEISSPSGVRGWGEVIAWGGDKSMLAGINGWYGEKKDWVNNTGRVTGHYTQMIDPTNLYVGLGTFCSEDTYCYNTTVGQFSSESGLNESRGTSVADCYQTLEVPVKDLGNYSLSGKQQGKVGEQAELVLTTSIRADDGWGKPIVISGLRVLGNVTWTSADSSIAMVSGDGVVTAKSCGGTTITATGEGGARATMTFTVPHSWDAGKIIKEATVKKGGTKLVTCTTCGATKTESTPKIKIAKGKSYTVGNLKYKITNANKKGKGTVTVTGSTLAKTDVKTLKIANTVKIGGISFRITAIGDKAFRGDTGLTGVSVGKYVTSVGKEAFYGCTSLTKATLGAGVTKIGTKAFMNCTKLTTLKISSKKLKSVGKNAVRGIAAKAVIKAPSSKVKSYKKLFKKSTGFQKTMKVKK